MCKFTFEAEVNNIGWTNLYVYKNGDFHCHVAKETPVVNFDSLVSYFVKNLKDDVPIRFKSQIRKTLKQVWKKS